MIQFLGLTHGMHPRAPLGQPFIVVTPGLDRHLLVALDGTGGQVKLLLRFAVQLLGLQHVSLGKRFFALYLQGSVIDALLLP